MTRRRVTGFSTHDAFLEGRNVPAPRRGKLVRLPGEVQKMCDICDFAVGLSPGFTDRPEAPATG